MHVTSYGRDDAILKYLLDESLVQDVNEATEFNETALHFSAWRGSRNHLLLLLSCGANPAIASGYLDTASKEYPVHVAARQGHTDVLTEFIDRGCDLKVDNGEDLDCEMIACEWCHTDLAKILGRHARELSKSP